MKSAIVFLTACFLAASAQAQSTATLTFHGRTAALGVGFAWGAATLEFEGKTYPVRVDGFVLGGVGTASVEAKGEVTGLTRAEDLSGDFTAVATGVTVGRGSGRFVMRNDKGVRIELDGTASGLQLGVGPRGITFEVGEAGGPPADATARLPQTLGFGEMRLRSLYLRPTLNVQTFGSMGSNAGFNGDWSFGRIDDSDNGYFETSNEAGMNARLPLGPEAEYGTLQARVSGLFSLTTSAPDMPACVSRGTAKDYSLESAYLKWQSGGLFPALGENAITLSGGNQNYQVFDGLLFWDGGQDCAGRGANWLSPRKAFEETGIAQVSYRDLMLEAVHLKYNDKPGTDTALWGTRAEWASDAAWMKHVKIGFMFFNVYDSDTATRDGLDGYYVYNEATPLPMLPDFSYKASYVREENSNSSGLSSANAWYVAPFYKLSMLPWTPTVSYRYAYFSGGGDNAFDALFTGLPDWGYWFQGELLGESVLSNSNLISHQARVKLQPRDWLAVNVIYYRFELDNQNQAFGLAPGPVSSHALADEFDLIFDVTMTNWWSITATVATAIPRRGFKDAVGGSSTWVNGYVYMNFNF